MSKTIREIAQEVLQNIGRLPVGQTAKANHLKTVEDSYTGLHADLVINGFVNFGVDDEIPEEFSDTLIDYLSGRVSGRFGVRNDWTATKGQVDDLRLKLSSLVVTPYVSQTTDYEEF